MIEPAPSAPPTVTGATHPWPPAPHDPRERIVGARVNGWEVRVFAPTDARRAYLAARGFGHLQLWHPEARVSILTPSRLTGGHFEVFPVEGWKYPVGDASAVREIVQQVFRLPLPRPARLAALVEWFVRAIERQALRPIARTTPPRRRTAGEKNPSIDLHESAD